jgi:hypothetical protein
MSPEVAALWDRALKAFAAANALVEVDPDGAASRAYYAAFHAVSALLALEGRSFTKHTAVAAAVHRELVRPGRWTAQEGEAYTWLLRARQTGDYGQDLRVTPEEAEQAVGKAYRILDAVRRASPEPLP